MLIKCPAQGSCLNIYLPLVQNCQNLRRIPLPRVPTWSVCGLDPVHHLRTRALFFLTAVIYYLDKCVLRYFNSFTCKEEREKFTPKKSGKSTLTADLSFNAPLILIAPKLVFGVADAFFKPEVVKNSLSSFYHCFIAVEGRSKNSLSLFFLLNC